MKQITITFTGGMPKASFVQTEGETFTPREVTLALRSIEVEYRKYTRDSRVNFIRQKEQKAKVSLPAANAVVKTK